MAEKSVDRVLSLTGMVVAAGAFGLWFSSLFWTPEGVGEVAHPLDYVTAAIWVVAVLLTAFVVVRFVRSGGDDRGRIWIATGIAVASMFVFMLVISMGEALLRLDLEVAVRGIYGAWPLLAIGLGSCSIGLFEAVSHPRAPSSRHEAPKEPPRIPTA